MELFGDAELLARAAAEEAPAEDGRPRFIHLLYVPTRACSMRCTYCYLSHPDAEGRAAGGALLPGEQGPRGAAAAQCGGHANAPAPDPTETLAFAVEKLRAAGIVPFALALHGGEPTCLAPETFEALVAYIDRYYRENAALLDEAGFPAPRAPHIKTNLLNIDAHLDAIARFNVTVSGSLDLPLLLHRAYRRDRQGADTLDRILENLALLAPLPNRKKASATIFREHFERLDEIIADIRWLHANTCLDMNEFNFMVGFADPACPLTPLSPDEQVRFYRALHEAFDGTELDRGVNGPWFAEFTPSYCTGCTNCGEKFFLLDADGEVWSCVRGQGHERFHYGNILQEPAESILRAGKAKIFAAHNAAPLDAECAACPWLRLCRTGCPFVKELYGQGRSYTCLLQRAIYRDRPDLYPPAPDPAASAYAYARAMRPAQAAALRPDGKPMLPGGIPPLTQLIADDRNVTGVFDADAFVLELDGERYRLESQLLKPQRCFAYLSRGSRAALYVRRDVMEKGTPWPQNNALHLMLLSGETVRYGDEGRKKQAHLATHQVFLPALSRMPSDEEGFYRFDASGFLDAYYELLSADAPNNLFVTTTALRDAHYAKHKANAYYHIQTINLPFPNIELVRDDEDGPTSEGGR